MSDDNESIGMIELTRKNVVQSFVDIYGGCLDMLSTLLNNYAQKHIASGGDYTSYAASRVDKVAGRSRLAYKNVQLKINQDRCVSTAVLNFFADY